MINSDEVVVDVRPGNVEGGGGALALRIVNCPLASPVVDAQLVSEFWFNFLEDEYISNGWFSTNNVDVMDLPADQFVPELHDWFLWFPGDSFLKCD